MLLPRFPDASCAWNLLSNHGIEQVIAPFLILLRVVNRRALTSDIIIPGGISSTSLSQGESIGGSGLTPDGKGANLVGTRGKTSDELAVAVETTFDVYRDGVQGDSTRFPPVLPSKTSTSQDRSRAFNPCL